MATLYITEFVRNGRDGSGQPVIHSEDVPMAEQTVAIGAASVQSAAFNAATRIVRLHADVTCSIAVGANPVATASKRRIAQNATEYIAVPAGAAFKVAVITNV